MDFLSYSESDLLLDLLRFFETYVFFELLCYSESDLILDLLHYLEVELFLELLRYFKAELLLELLRFSLPDCLQLCLFNTFERIFKVI